MAQNEGVHLVRSLADKVLFKRSKTAGGDCNTLSAAPEYRLLGTPELCGD